VLSFTTPTSTTVPAAEDRIRHLQEVYNEVKTMIDLAGVRAQRYYNQGVQVQPTFQVGEKVFLRHDNILITAPSKKLASRFLGPFPIIARLSELVYKLKLPKTLRIHDVFQVALLQRHHEDTIEGRRRQPPPPIITPDEDVQWEVHAVLDSRLHGRWRKLQYFVSWEGYGPEENSWEPVENLQNAADVVRDFHRLYPDAVGSTPLRRRARALRPYGGGNVTSIYSSGLTST
jgi:hypothetical protein